MPCEPVNWPRALQLSAGEHRLCGCRSSECWPQCDGSRQACAAQALELSLSRPRFVWMCQCGGSADMPFCDGEAHIRLERARAADD